MTHNLQAMIEPSSHNNPSELIIVIGIVLAIYVFMKIVRR